MSVSQTTIQKYQEFAQEFFPSTIMKAITSQNN